MIKSKKHLKSLVGVSFAELKKISENRDSYYREKKELKKDKNGRPRTKQGKLQYRVLNPSQGRLKYVQKKLVRTVLSKVILHDAVYGGVRGKDNIKNGRCHQGKKYKFLTDLRKFFPSITTKMVFDGLIRKGFSSDIAHIITGLTTYKGKVPQGAPTSTHIANIAVACVDDEILDITNEYNITYTRFVDDLSFSSDKPFQPLTKEILAIISKYNLSISHRKTFYSLGSVDMTGVRVKNNGIDVTASFKKKLANPDKFESQQVEGHKNYAARVKHISLSGI